jgi:hypothetical protein
MFFKKNAIVHHQRPEALGTKLTHMLKRNIEKNIKENNIKRENNIYELYVVYTYLKK